MIEALYPWDDPPLCVAWSEAAQLHLQQRILAGV